MNFIKIFLLSSFIIITIFGGLIIGVDPYDKLGINFFGMKTKAVAQSRENKYYMFESSKKDYKAFILGSSAAHRYPTKTLKELTGLETFNYAVQHTTPIDYLAIIKHILSKSRPELIILQLDFSGLDKRYFVDKRLYNSPLKKFLKQEEIKDTSLFENNYFTLEALRDTLRVFYVNWFGEARHIYLPDGNYIDEKILIGPVKIKQRHNHNYKFDYSRIEVLKEIQEICDQNQIKLYAIAAPMSYEHLLQIFNDPHVNKIHQKFIQELDGSFTHFTNFQTKEMDKYNSTRYFHDSVHPTKEMSSLILQKTIALDNES